MKKYEILILAFTLAAINTVIFSSCNKAKTTTEEETMECNPIDPTESILFSHNVGNNIKENNIEIIRIVLHRKAYNCDKKLGICEIYIFGQQIYKLDQDSLLPSRDIIYELSNGEETGNLTLLIATDVHNIDPVELDLYVDEDIYGYNDDSSKKIIVPQGVYHYNPNMGEHGGYMVNYSYSSSI